MSYFNNFKNIVYKNYTVKNILESVKIRDLIEDDVRAYLPYTIKDGDTIESIAYHYYGGVNYFWLVCLSNNIVDPYYNWPMSISNFNKHIIKKYGSSDIAKSTIKHYKDGDGMLYSPDSYIYSPHGVGSWVAVDAYTAEDELNEENRNILLLDKAYLGKAEENLKELLDGNK